MTKPTSGDPCLGLLSKTNTFKHFVYQVPTMRIPGPQDGSQSLKDILYSASQQNRQEDWVAKLKVARLLSLAVLRFYSTPWLSESWSSNDIHFFKKERPSLNDQVFESPFINARLSVEHARGQISNSSEQSLATNKELHSLGVILLELANDAPFEILSQAEDLQDNTNIQIRDFLAARRLVDKVHQKFNVTYAAIVEKCLNCNFGVATKLKEAELQSAVLVHVVHQLDVCLDQYMKFNSLAPVPMI